MSHAHFSTRDCLYEGLPFPARDPNGTVVGPYPTWASAATKMFVVGLASKKLGKSSNHNVLGSPANCTAAHARGRGGRGARALTPSTYTDFACQLAFAEDELWGSAAAWAPADFPSPELFDDLIVAQWARQCEQPRASTARPAARPSARPAARPAAFPTDPFCFEVGEDLVPSNAKSSMTFLGRDYLDPVTRTGPPSDAMLFPRVIVLDSLDP